MEVNYLIYWERNVLFSGETILQACENLADVDNNLNVSRSLEFVAGGDEYYKITIKSKNPSIQIILFTNKNEMPGIQLDSCYKPDQIGINCEYKGSEESKRPVIEFIQTLRDKLKENLDKGN